MNPARSPSAVAIIERPRHVNACRHTIARSRTDDRLPTALRSPRAFRPRLLACIAACALLSPAVHSEDRAPKTPGIDPKVDEVFSAMSAHLSAAKQFSFENRASIDRVLDTGLRVQYSRRSRAVVKRPNALATTAVGDVEDSAYWYLDGKLSMLDRRTNTYAQLDVPKTIDEMLDHMAAQYGMVVPLCDLLFHDPRKACLQHVYTGVYVGLHDVEGTRCHHLAFRQDGVDWQIWIAEGAEPLPRKVVITYKDLPDSPQFVALLDKWNLADEQPATAFEFTPPAGATRVELPVVTGTADRGTPKPQPHGGGE